MTVDWNTGNFNEQVLGHDAHPDLHIVEVFTTIQGEGPYVGRPACFIRLAGCNLACSFCDTDYRLDPSMIRSVESVVDEAQESGVDLMVITGGEPFRQAAVIPLIEELYRAGATVQVETNGTMWPVPKVKRQMLPPRCSIVVSPKTSKVHPMIHAHRPSWKYLVAIDVPVAQDDGLPLHLARKLKGPNGPVEPNSDIWLSPIDDDNKQANGRLAADLCIEHGYTLSVQIHKMVGLR